MDFDLTEEQRHGIIIGRGQELVAALPVAEEAVPAARDLRELVLESTTAGGTDE